jgi:hypothetical protein
MPKLVRSPTQTYQNRHHLEPKCVGSLEMHSCLSKHILLFLANHVLPSIQSMTHLSDILSGLGNICLVGPLKH